MNVHALPLWVNGLIIAFTIALVGLGAHWVVESAARVAKRLGISELVIGLTIVAFGTSAPEFAVTLIAASKGQGDISVGNIVGSNIFNLGFILGGCALVRAIPIGRTMLRRDGAVLGGTSRGSQSSSNRLRKLTLSRIASSVSKRTSAFSSVIL